MSRFRAYIAPIAEDGSGHLDWIEVTDDVDFQAMGSIEQKIDSSDYDVGLFSFSDFSFSLRNEHGLYSLDSFQRSIFQAKRNDSLFRLTWQKQNFPSKAGMVKCGQFIANNTEIVVFEGIIKDEAAQMQIDDQKVNLTVLGKESIISKALVPYSSIAAGITVKNFIFACLNQTAIKLFFDVDLDNISPDLNLAIDDISGFENQTVSEALSDVLVASNSIMTIESGVVYVTSRDPSAEVLFNFYGQGSNIGIENILDIKDIREGINRTFNFWTWDETSLVASNATSIENNGVLKKALNFDFITDNTKRQSILNALRDEFSDPKQEFILITPINIGTLALELLNRVDIDYPNVYFTEEGKNFPIYGVSVYGGDRYPFGQWSMNITSADNFKIIGRRINTKDQAIEFKMRKI